ncbi:unnamed protein product [Closterium sp. NIES-54]
MAARIASKSRSKIATPDLSRSLQRGISVASGNWAHQASVRRPKQRWVACRPPHCSPVRSPVRRTSASAGSTSTATSSSASSTPPATATAASTSTVATEAPTPTPSSSSTATTAARTTSSSSLAPLALVDAAPLIGSRCSADRLDHLARHQRQPLDPQHQRVGAEQGPERGSNGAEIGSGPGQVRDRVGAEQGLGQSSNGAGTGSGLGQVRDGVEAEWLRRGRVRDRAGPGRAEAA